MEVVRKMPVQNLPCMTVLSFLEAVGSKRCTYRMCNTILSELKGLVPYDTGYLFIFDPHGRISSCSTENVDERSKKHYFNYFVKIDPRRLNTPFDARGMYSDWKDYEESEFYFDFGKKEKVHFSAGLQFHYSDGRLMGILFITRSGPVGFGSQELRFLDLVHSHLENFLSLVSGSELLNRVFMDHTDRRRVLNTLTPREKQVVALISRGVHTKEIGSYLLIRTSTVYRHVSNIFEKVNVSSREELMALIGGRLR